MSDVNKTLSESLEVMFRQVNTAIYKHGRSILAGMQVSTLQFNALLTLKEFGSLTMGELARYLFTACSTATDLADRLERAGFVERVRSQKDRRVVSINLLPKGEEIVNSVIIERQVFLGEVLKQYSDQEKVSLQDALEILTSRIERVDSTVQLK
ncbi:MAG TPA: MarR family transcriptional regulator, partial [Desulfitobacteriaceae bacterium]|nr:MarR family transcriptional regulator [Desulfitobacteriaceae bacterium]